MNIKEKLNNLKEKHDLKNKNKTKHADCDSLYGHMSMVFDIEDYDKYPNLKKTNPQTFTLNKGEALIIPKGWWHYVVSYGDMYGCNFWTSKTLSKLPLKIKHNIKLDYDDLKDEIVYIWKSDLHLNSFCDTIQDIKFDDYIKSKNNNEYFWTLKNYSALSKNSHLTNKIKNNIEIPEIIKQTNENFEFNIMACSKKNATPLHYDDEDGLLCVTNGVKFIKIFPPEDTINLYPIKFERYGWKNSPAIDCIYNLFQRNGLINGCSSANFLYETCNNNLGVLSSISKIIKEFHGNDDDDNSNKTIWAYKKQGDDYGWELYNYQDKNVNIKSFEIYPKRQSYGEYVSNFFDEYVITKNDESYYEGLVYRNDQERYKRGYWIIDTQDNFIKNYYTYLEKLNYSKDIFKDDIIKKYKCKFSCIHQKNNQEFYIQYIGISNDDFLSFLKDNNYNLDLINHYEKSNYKISNEITIVYDILTKDVKRSAFYGIV